MRSCLKKNLKYGAAVVPYMAATTSKTYTSWYFGVVQIPCTQQQTAYSQREKLKLHLPLLQTVFSEFLRTAAAAVGPGLDVLLLAAG